MKILIVLPNDSLGGAEQYLKMIAQYYESADINIYFFRTSSTKQWNDLPAQVKLNFMSHTSEARGVFNFVRHMLFKRPKFDYIFTSHIYTNSLLGFLRSTKIVKSKKLISRESTSIFLRYKGIKLWRYKLIYCLGYKNIDLLICQTQRMQNQLIQNFKKLTKHVNVQVIPNPIDLGKIKNASSLTNEIDFDFPYIVSAGRLMKAKGFDILIKSFSSVKLDFPELKLIILGKGGQKESLIELAASLNLQNDVILPGHVDNVYEFFKKAQLCVVSSRIEGFPNVLLQMMSQNHNVVSTTCAGGIDTIDGLYTCIPNDKNELYLAMKNCLNGNNVKNREVFEAFLHSRDIKSFVKTVEEIVEE